MKEDINCIFEGIDGIGAIYISGIHAARNLSTLKKYKIKAVLTAARSGFIDYDKNDVEHYLYIPADDHQDFNLMPFFDQTFTFIEATRKKTNVLVHCMAGISRSSTIVIAYLLKKYGYSLEKTLTLAKRKRQIVLFIKPNQGFMVQIQKFRNNLLEINREIKQNKQMVESNPEKNKPEQNFSLEKFTQNVPKYKNERKSMDHENSKSNSLSKQSRLLIARMADGKNKKASTNFSSIAKKKYLQIFDEDENEKEKEKSTMEDKINRIKYKVLKNETEARKVKLMEKSKTYDTSFNDLESVQVFRKRESLGRSSPRKKRLF